ncbi:zinc knuckle CX2CX4HX4C containing protein [Tanacetum coccineum]|uniref:Zinc knuckle CX2CX4HX4C containing protein n=1 Tax=Tanacetum coccineum TaxID=301880 RepID=A0ABQ5IAH9_9ASTR
MRMPMIMLIESSTLWVDRLTPGAVNTWDLLKKPLSKGIVHHPRPLNDLKTSTTSSRKAMNRYTKLGNGLNTMNRQLLDSQGPIPGMTTTQALTAIQTMADHFQKWHDGTSSRNISSSSNTDGLAAIISKLDNLGRDMKKLKENVHAIQVGCQIYEGPHLDKECPLNEEVKQLEEVKYREFGRSAPFSGSNGPKFRVGPPGYYTRTDNRPPYGEKRPSLEELMNKHQEESARRSAEMKEWTTNGTPSSSVGECKVVNNDHETQHRPISSRKLNDKEDWTTKDIQCQFPPKELNPGNFTLPCTIGNFNFYGMTDLGASVNVMHRNTFEYLRLTNLRNTNMLVKMADMTKKAPLEVLKTSQVRINNS